MITADQLQPFCSIDPERIYLHRPWSRGEFTFATNGHVLVRVPRLADVADHEEAPNCDKIFAKTADQVDLSPLPALNFHETEEQVSATLNGAICDAKYLTLISRLPQPVLFSLSPPKDGPARFTFGGDGEGALMPMIWEHEKHIKIKGQEPS